MRAQGISYDTGFVSTGGVTTHDGFDPEAVARDMRVIRHELHCTAVRVTGGLPERIETAARLAAAEGLEVWVSPFTGDLSQDEILRVLADCAERAARIDGRVVVVTGAELSMFGQGFLPGATLADRLALLADPARLRAEIAHVPARVNAFLAEAVRVVRERFDGPVTYASIHFEGVDWAPFDVVSIDLYRTPEVAPVFRDGVRALVAGGKPVAITEFGAATHRGAADKGARGMEIVDYAPDGRVLGLTGAPVRDETEAAGLLPELLDLFDEEGVDTAFVYTYANFHLPLPDLDAASYGVVGVTADGARVPKAAFGAVAGWMERHLRRP